jgi:hypothetical protein
MGIAACTFVLTAVLATTAATVANSAERQSAFRVGAFVRPRVEMRFSDPPRLLRVSADDLRAGFVEVRPASVLEVRTNSREGYAVEIRPLHPDFAQVDIRYGDGIARMTGDTVRLVRPGRARVPGTLSLSYRFHLRDGLTPGDYPWPLEIAASAL